MHILKAMYLDTLYCNTLSTFMINYCLFIYLFFFENIYFVYNIIKYIVIMHVHYGVKKILLPMNY